MVDTPVIDDAENAEEGILPDLMLRVGAGTQKGVNTDLVTEEGTVAAVTLLAEEFPERAVWEIELLMNMAASDWTAGYEDRAQKALTREFGLMLALRVIALLVVTPGTTR